MDDRVSVGDDVYAVEKSEKVELEKERGTELSQLRDEESHETIDTDTEDLHDEEVQQTLGKGQIEGVRRNSPVKPSGKDVGKMKEKDTAKEILVSAILPVDEVKENRELEISPGLIARTDPLVVKPTIFYDPETASAEIGLSLVSIPTKQEHRSDSWVVNRLSGRKEKLSVSKGSEIEVSSDEFINGTGNVWYSAILEENLAKSKKKKLSVRYLDPLLKKDYSPPLINSTVQQLIRPVPPPDLFPDVGFEVGDIIDAAHIGGWWCGVVVLVLEDQHYMVHLRFERFYLDIERKHLRPHMVWKNDEWFRCENQKLGESNYCVGKCFEYRTEVDNLGDVWTPAIVIKDNEDGTMMAKPKSLSNIEDICTNISVPFSKVRPSHPGFDFRFYKVMDRVDALLNSRWCPGVVSKVISDWPEEYIVVLGPNKESKKFVHYHLRPSMEYSWKDRVWVSEEKVSDSMESLHEGKMTPSTRIRETAPTALRDQKNALATEKEVKATHSSTSSNRVDVTETGKVSVTERETPVPATATHLTGELRSKLATTVIKENTPVTRQPEIGTTKEFHSPVVLGIAATLLTKPVVRTRGKTSPRKKLQAMENLKESANYSKGEKAPEETTIREIVNKRKRGRPRKFISTEPKQKTGVAANDSKAATIELANMTDDNRPLASSGQSVSRSPDPMRDSVVEKLVDVVETPPAKESTMVLPFVKKSPLWKVLESMEVFKAVPQHPHFSPLLESEEESREGDAIGKMVMYTDLLEKLNNLQVDHPISLINRIDECLIKLEKHGFNVTEPRSRIAKLLSIKERQTRTLEEFKAVEEKITESDNKRRKYEEDIVELQRP